MRKKKVSKYEYRWGVWLVGTKASKIKADWCTVQGRPYFYPRYVDAEIMAYAWRKKDFVKKATVKRVKVEKL